MRCACGGNSEVLERRGQRRRRRCLACGARWTTVEVRVGIKPPSLPPTLARLSKQGKVAKTPRRMDQIELPDADDLADTDITDFTAGLGRLTDE